MSTSLLYHAFMIRGYEYVRTQYLGGMIVLTIKQPRDRLRCACCGSENVYQRGHRWRLYHTLPIGGKPVWIEFNVPRVSCQVCGAWRQVRVAFADERKRHTRAFARYILELSRFMTIKDVARHLGVGWDLVKEIQKEYLEKNFGKPKLRQVTQIAIDEISIRKGQRYVTIVLDLESGVVLYVGDGKKASALEPFWKRLKASRAKIEAVAMDMSAAYISAVTKQLPEAKIVFDRFHITKLFNEALTTLRRQLYHQATEELHKDVLKGIRWLLLKHSDNLDETRNEHQRLKDALELNASLATAYYLKEDLRQLWEQPHKTAARNFFTSWYLRAMESGIRVIQTFAKTLLIHAHGILAWYQYPISTGPLEGTNNKIKTMKRQAYGFRDMEFFKLRIFAIHLTRYRLVGC